MEEQNLGGSLLTAGGVVDVVEVDGVSTPGGKILFLCLGGDLIFKFLPGSDVGRHSRLEKSILCLTLVICLEEDNECLRSKPC